MKDITKELAKMESYTMFLREKMESCKDVNSPQIDAQIQCNPNKNSESFPFSASWFYIYNGRAKGQERLLRDLLHQILGLLKIVLY